MKLITAIINKDDSKAVRKELVAAGFSVTHLSTTGGFLMSGNVTLLIGVEDEKVDQCIDLIEQNSSRRTEIIPAMANYGAEVPGQPLEVTVGGATVFVTNVERFEKL